MPYIQGEDRNQLTLTPMCLDDYIEPDSLCRVIAAYVGSLDMAALGFKYAVTRDTGRLPHNPANMLMLYLYGYLNRIRSSRRLEAETKRNIEVMWLMEKVMPDDKTICNFRKDNADALKKVFREFSLWCSRQGLYGKELVAVDGTKIRADNSGRNVYSRRSTEKRIERVEKRIDEYLRALEENDFEDTEESAMSKEAILSAIAHLQDKKSKLETIRSKIEANGGGEISTADPDCRIMKQGGNARSMDACYNIQAVTDDKNKLIVDFEVTNCADDKGALPKMTESAKEIMGVDEITVVADKGYYDGEDIAICESNGTTCIVSKMRTGCPVPNPEYGHKHFRYDKESDSYICPAGFALTYKRSSKRKLVSTDGVPKHTEVRKYYNINACKNCENKSQCTKDKVHRSVTRSQYQDVLDVHDTRLDSEENREKLRRRKEIVEHPFGTIKHGWGYRQFLCRGLLKTGGEQSLTFLAYNLRRVFNIFKQNEKSMLEAIGV